MFEGIPSAATDGGTRGRDARSSARTRSRRAFRPDLDDCWLEDRLTPIVPNLGVIVLTTGGYMLIIPFPGAFTTPASLGTGLFANSSPGLSGTPYNLPYFMLGGSGISSSIPGNITGFPGLGAGGPAGSTGPAMEIDVGSGANDASAPVIPVVTRNTVAYDQLNPPPLIGGQPDTTAPLLPPPPLPAPAPSPPPSTGTSTGPSMPPPGSSLSGPFVRFPSMFPRNPPLGFPMGSPVGAAPGGPPPITPPPPPGSGQSGSP